MALIIVLLNDFVGFFVSLSFLQTTMRPPLSAGLMTMPSHDLRCLRAAHSCFVKLNVLHLVLK